MQKQITKAFGSVTDHLAAGLQRIDALIYFVIGGEKKPTLDEFTGVLTKVVAVEYAGHWLEDVAGELCYVSEKALQYRKPSRELLSLLDKTLPMGASMLSVAKEFKRLVAAASEADGKIDFDTAELHQVWLQFEHLRVVLLQAGLKVPTRKTYKP